MFVCKCIFKYICVIIVYVCVFVCVFVCMCMRIKILYVVFWPMPVKHLSGGLSDFLMPHRLPSMMDCGTVNNRVTSVQKR